MKKLTLTIVSLMVLCMQAVADNGQTITIGGSIIEKYAQRLTFDGNNVTITFEDGSEETADMTTVSIDLTYGGNASGISSVTATSNDNGKVYSISGQYVGNTTEGLPKGLYIMNGKKMVIK